jgi:uncharacterized protein YndB with AHSA1/START domain
MAEKNNTFTLTRAFNAPRQLVFEAFTRAEHLAHWWGPVGFKLKIHQLSLQPGGTLHYSMVNEAGFEMWGLFKYLEIHEPEKIVFLNGFSDKEGNMARAPFPGFENWPLEVHNTWTFTEKDGVTTITLTGVPHNATPEEEQLFFSGTAGMEVGFNGTFSQLDSYLTTITRNV